MANRHAQISKDEAAAAKHGQAAASDPAEWVARYGDLLYRYALTRVRHADVAEDVVQEALLAAMKSRDNFDGRSSEQTWLIGILRHKILDHIRSRSRGIDGITEETSTDWLADFFDERGRWRVSAAPDPAAVNADSLVEREEFWAVFEKCMDNLPPRSREILARRIFEQEDISSISGEVNLTENNIGVILFRARTQMRRCISIKWLGAAPDEEATQGMLHKVNRRDAESAEESSKR